MGPSPTGQAGLETLSLPDAAITASADLSGCTLVTRTPRDLAALAGMLSVECYGDEL